MDCRNAREALIDREVQRVDAAADGELASHLESCAVCRAHARSIGRLWADLGRVETPALDHASASRIETALALAVSRDTSTARPAAVFMRRLMLPAVASGALAAGLLLGLAVGSDDVRNEAAAPAHADAPRYLLLLHEPATPAAGGDASVDARIREYGDWARSLRAEGRLVLAEKLGDEPPDWLPDDASLAPGSVVSGFFLITAANGGEALRIARGSPHLKYGGRIEVRRIEET